MRALLCSAALALLAAPVWAADPPTAVVPAPATGQVEMTRATAGAEGVILLTQLRAIQKDVIVTETRVVDGKQVPVTVTKKVTAVEAVQVPLSPKAFKATGTDGKAITADDLEKRLKGGAVVAAHQGPLSVELRKVFKDETVFIEWNPPAKKGQD